MTDGKQARAKDGGDKAKDHSSSDDGGLFGRVMGGLKTAKDAVVDNGGKALSKGKDLIVENAPKVKDAVVENAPKVKQAAVDAANSDAGKKVIKVGKDVYEDEKKHVVGIGEAAKRGDVKTLVREGAPLLAGGPAGLAADRIADHAMKQGVKALPPEHQGTARDVVNVGRIANGGIPDARQVITGTVLDEDKRGKAMDAVSGAGKKVWGWIKGGDDDAKGEAKSEAKAGAKAEKVDYPSDYPDNEKPQDLPKRKATKK